VVIVADVQLVSAISEDRNETLCRVEIFNDGTGTHTRGNYGVRLYSRGDKPRLIREARVENWPREARPAWRLVQAAMEALG
jgi:hypothetical protein